jgi:hypothetical protein
MDGQNGGHLISECDLQLIPGGLKEWLMAIIIFMRKLNGLRSATSAEIEPCGTMRTPEIREV